jgi:hypothetical protein
MWTADIGRSLSPLWRPIAKQGNEPEHQDAAGEQFTEMVIPRNRCRSIRAQMVVPNSNHHDESQDQTRRPPSVLEARGSDQTLQAPLAPDTDAPYISRNALT